MAASARHIALAISLLAGAFTVLTPSCLQRYDSDTTPTVNECTRCHGDAGRSGTALQRAAPPRDLYGNTTSEYPGVGAHQRHLYASATHGAVACDQCHIVPKHVQDPGHMDSKRPAELHFGDLASEGNRTPNYDYGTRRCSDTYCHRSANPEWTHPRAEADTCGTCHGLPPPKPHPQTTQCQTCHGDVVERDGDQLRIIAPDKHVDGKVELRSVTCHDCHGSENNPAPPRDTKGNTDTSSPGVGAHQIHLSGGEHGRPLECNECHHVPQKWDDPAHMDGAPAEVNITGVGTTDGRTPEFDYTSLTCGNTWCHSPEPGTSKASPVWTAVDKPLACDSCHGYPPAAPHPQMTNCSFCHTKTVGSDNKTIIDRALHVDGVVEVDAPTKCNSCHGNAQNNAPPVDVEGETATTAIGVGAHQAHLMGSNWARAVQCNECHVVPTNWRDPGHLDTPRPAELTFSGVAASWGAQPVIVGATCQNTYCHGDHFVAGHASGGSLTQPVWTKVDGTQAVCGSCHSLPPPAPHPANADNCSTCHQDIDANRNFIRPDLHVDGEVTFIVP